MDIFEITYMANKQLSEKLEKKNKKLNETEKQLIKQKKAIYTGGELSDIYDKDFVEEVIVKDGIASIGRYAFWGCSKLKSITIPDSVMEIEYRAFEGCYQLTSITIPDSVMSIGQEAFCNCTALISIIISDSVGWISSRAFEGCDKLTIKCNKGSYAESYAIENDIPVEYI